MYAESAHRAEMKAIYESADSERLVLMFLAYDAMKRVRIQTNIHAADTFDRARAVAKKLKSFQKYRASDKFGMLCTVEIVLMFLLSLEFFWVQMCSFIVSIAMNRLITFYRSIEMVRLVLF